MPCMSCSRQEALEGVLATIDRRLVASADDDDEFSDTAFVVLSKV